MTTRDTIGVFAPSGYDADPARLPRAIERFVARGNPVVTCLALDRHHERFSGTDAERLGWLHKATVDADIGIALALRGGYGATRLLPRVDFGAMAAAVRVDGKRFVGHSDFTVLSLALLATTGAISFAGPMASYDFGGDAVEQFTEECFWRAMEASEVDLAFATDFDGSCDVEGPLWGGNLAMLTSLIGTRWLPRIDGGILFVEDVNEQPYRVERMLMQLKQAGLLDRQRLVLCGEFSGHRVAAYDDGYDLASAIARVRAETDVPIVTGLPFGHVPTKATLAVGAPCVVAVADRRCRLRQRWRLASG